MDVVCDAVILFARVADFGDEIERSVQENHEVGLLNSEFVVFEVNYVFEKFDFLVLVGMSVV